MYGIAIFSSGNHALSLCRMLEKKGYVFEVISTPCQIARDGCSYCLKFPLDQKDVVLNEGMASKLFVREIYQIVPLFSKNKYERIY